MLGLLVQRNSKLVAVVRLAGQLTCSLSDYEIEEVEVELDVGHATILGGAGADRQTVHRAR